MASLDADRPKRFALSVISALPERLPMLLPAACFTPSLVPLAPAAVPSWTGLVPGFQVGAEPAVVIVAAGDPEEEEEDIGDEEDLAVSQPATDEESAFDDFDDEFDDDFEEDEDDPDWDHPDEGDAEPPPPAKGPGRKK